MAKYRENVSIPFGVTLRKLDLERIDLLCKWEERSRSEIVRVLVDLGLRVYLKYVGTFPVEHPIRELQDLLDTERTQPLIEPVLKELGD